MNGAPLVPTGQTRLSPKAAERARSVAGCRVTAEWIALLLFPLSFQAQERSVTIGHCLWKKREGGDEEGKRRPSSTKPILKCLWKGQRKRWGERGKLQKQMRAQDPSGSQILSVWAENSLRFQVLSLVAVWLSQPLPCTKPQAIPTPPRHKASCWKKEFYENQLIPFFSPPLVLGRRL